MIDIISGKKSKITLSKHFYQGEFLEKAIKDYSKLGNFVKNEDDDSFIIDVELEGDSSDAGIVSREFCNHLLILMKNK